MLKIRLQRVGRKNNPSFMVVVIDSKRGPKSKDFVERVGSYDAIRKTKSFDEERVKHWLNNGAKASDTVHNLLVASGIITGNKLNVLPKKSPIVKEKKEEPKPQSAEQPEENTSEEPKEEVKTAEPKEEVVNPEEETKQEAKQETQEPTQEAPETTETPAKETAEKPDSKEESK